VNVPRLSQSLSPAKGFGFGWQKKKRNKLLSCKSVKVQCSLLSSKKHLKISSLRTPYRKAEIPHERIISPDFPTKPPLFLETKFEFALDSFLFHFVFFLWRLPHYVGSRSYTLDYTCLYHTCTHFDSSHVHFCTESVSTADISYHKVDPMYGPSCLFRRRIFKDKGS